MVDRRVIFPTARASGLYVGRFDTASSVTAQRVCVTGNASVVSFSTPIVAQFGNLFLFVAGP
ncbi:hypothetical protein Pan189_11080 [Stratiformator vulcanicus]|uniref:Uncharacterized protein n=1 Tax=Stratiformator vulcanicus TaxID=2527980 RepID=A0A517QYM4_9PLAN|nr:hypothetical protein Pan189_11080 [Stratiformator vulcanicus]